MAKKQSQPRTIYQQKRKESKLSQEKAAELLDMSARNLQYIESGRREPKLGTGFRMARAYRCSILEFEPETQKTEGEEAFS